MSAGAGSSPDTLQDAAVTLEKTVQDALALIRAEFSLAKRELGEEVSSVVSAAVSLIVALMLVQAGLATLGVLLVLTAHSLGLGLVVVAAFMALAGVFALVGLGRLKQKKSRTVSRLKLDAQQIAKAVK